MSCSIVRSKRRRLALGFTLLEVMVAVAILGLGLSAIFAAQAGALANVSHARELSQATGFARCRMSEIESDITLNGFAENDIAEAGPCCDNVNDGRMSCAWNVDRPEFPDAKFGELDLDSDLDLGSKSGSKAGGSGLSALSGLAQGKDIPQGGDVSQIAEGLMGDGGMLDQVTNMLMGIVYPDLKATFEAGTRKITVTVSWNEGSLPQSFTIVQYVTNAKAAGVIGDIPTADDESTTSGTASGGSTKTGGPEAPFKPPAPRTK